MVDIEELQNLIETIPEETAKRLNLEDMIEIGKIEEVDAIVKKIINFRKNIPDIIVYHTSDIKYEIGDEISPSFSKRLYKGKIFVSKSANSAFVGDNPTFCYKIKIDYWIPDPDDLTKKDWGYTITPARVLAKIPMEEIFRTKELYK